MQTIMDGDKNEPSADQKLAGGVLDLICLGGQGLGPSPKRAREIRQGIGPRTVQVSARKFAQLMDLLETAYPGSIERYLNREM